MIACGQPRFSHRPGITLLEVLLGLAIFLVALVALGRLVDMGTDNAIDSMLHADGTRLAQSKLAEFEAGALDAKTGGSGIFEEEPNWSWKAEATDSGIPNLYTLKVTVSHEKNGRSFDISMEQMIVLAEAMGTAAEVARPESAGTTP